MSKVDPSRGDDTENAPHRTPANSAISLITSSRNLKLVKDSLDSHGLFDRRSRIQRWVPDQQTGLVRVAWTGPPPSDTESLNSVPTRLSPPDRDDINSDPLAVLEHLPHTIRILIRGVAVSSSSETRDKHSFDPPVNKLVRSLHSFLDTLPPSILSQALDTDEPVSSANAKSQFTFPTSYTLYPPQLLLLPKAAFSAPEWTRILSLTTPEQRRSLFETIAREFGVSHIAIPGYIPVVDPAVVSNNEGAGISQAGRNANEDGQSLSSDDNNNNLASALRLPVEIEPLYGSFGPLHNHSSVVPVKHPFFAPSLPSMTHPLSSTAVSETLFVTVRQFGINLIFPPLRCMFSRGNVRERERLLHILAQPPTPNPGLPPPPPIECTAVDLFAGIGYFSLCYAASAPASGIRLVATWEINGWSVEAMFRGVVSNGWEADVVCLADQPSEPSTYACARTHRPRPGRSATPEQVRFVIHHAPHQTAGPIIGSNRSTWPPVRHVNLGYLPSSNVDGAWATALTAIDPHYGGWIRVHENVDIKPDDALAHRARQVENEFRSLFSQERCFDNTKASPGEIEVTDIVKVKSYSPGVLHCVFDVWIPGSGSKS